MRLLLLLALALAPLTVCLSYGVGATAAPTPEGARTFSALLEATPGADDGAACERLPEACLFAGAGVKMMNSNEIRLGLDARSDFGVRFVGGTGVVATYKRRLTPDASAVQVAAVGGGGMLNGFNSAAVEATLVVSPPEGHALTPYGGLRAQQTFDLSGKDLQDAPTLGAFAGVRLGSAAFGVSPEIGVHYDPSVTGQRRRTVIVVPVITLHGLGLLGLLGRLGGF